MKKLLYTTSALVGAAFLMEAVVPAKAEVNMSLRYRAALISQSKKDANKDKSLAGDDKKDRSTALNSAKINIDLSASKDHPNGLTTSATVAMSSGANKWDYDNAFGSIAGSFGKIDVGDMQDVGYRTLGYGTPGTSNFGAIDAGFQPSGGYVNTSATGNIGSRASGIAYWSPSFSGAQIGVSWHPQVATYKDRDDPSKGYNGIEGKKVGLSSQRGDIEDSIGFVASYSGSFGGTGVSMGVSYETAKTVSDKADAWDANELTYLEADGTLSSGSGASAATTLTPMNQDPSAYAGYVSFNINNFTVGGSYGAWESAAAHSNTTSESTAMALGASYSVDAITFGVGYGKQDTDNTHHNIRTGAKASGSISVTDAAGYGAYKQTLSNDILAFTVGYNLGDGAAIDFVIEQSSSEANTVADADTAVGKEETKTSGFGIGLDLKF